MDARKAQERRKARAHWPDFAGNQRASVVCALHDSFYEVATKITRSLDGLDAQLGSSRPGQESGAAAGGRELTLRSSMQI